MVPSRLLTWTSTFINTSMLYNYNNNHDSVGVSVESFLLSLLLSHALFPNINLKPSTLTLTTVWPELVLSMMGVAVGDDDVVQIQQGNKPGDPLIITVNCPDKTGLACDICRFILDFGLCIVKGGTLFYSFLLTLSFNLQLPFPLFFSSIGFFLDWLLLFCAPWNLFYKEF